jgi:ABC-type glycerol-3-phosphate transport system substrate-binding protein
MDKKNSPFQIVLLATFVVLGLAGIIIFAMTSGGGATEDVGDVYLWGTYPERSITTFLHDYGMEDRRTTTVQYTQKDPKTFYDDLAQALAAGQGPDIVITDHSHIEKLESMFSIVPFEAFPARTFIDAYIDASATSFIKSRGQETGIRAIPIVVDPLVMYWNRDIFARHATPQAPKYWDEFFAIAENMTERSENGNITVSGVALGEPSNVLHSKEIISAMIMQAGGDIIIRNADDGKMEVRLARTDKNSLSPAQSAMRFFTEFANPTKKRYSWNKSMPKSKEMFTNGDLAIYIGTASELKEISDKNPNLNFDIAPLPQLRGGTGTRLLTTGTIYAVAITKTGKNPSGGLAIAGAMSTGKAGEMLEKELAAPSAQRALLVPNARDPLTTTLRQEAVRMRVWPDPDPEKTEDILFRMVERITTGEDRISESVQRADGEMKILVRDSGK